MLLPPEKALKIQAIAEAARLSQAEQGSAPAPSQWSPSVTAPWELAEPVGLTQFVARRLAKTALLDPLRGEAPLVRAGETVLARIATYAIAASCTFGRTTWTPPADPQGTMVRETDSATGACITVACTSRRPLRLSATVELPGLGVLSWEEAPEATRLGFGQLVTSVALDVTFAGARGGAFAGYVVTISGRIEAKALPRIGGRVLRASGELTAHDSWAGVGRLELLDTGELAGRFIAGDGATAAVAGSVTAPVVVTAALLAAPAATHHPLAA